MFLKRIFDVCCSLLLIILFVPVLLVVAGMVYVKFGRPVFFCQQRPGLAGQPFTLYKFRSMKDERDGTGQLLEDAERMTPFGRLLRSSSLDELPELWNVLKGDMSLVGPRPLLMEYLDRYTQYQFRRHEVKPGITGWAQINGRNNLPWDERFDLDVWYVDNRSMRLDVKILWRTLGAVFFREDISQQGHVTMKKYMGTSKDANGK